MNVSINWLKELVDVPATPKELEQLFNLKSAEVSRLEKLVEASNLTVGYVKTCIDHPNSDHLHICEVEVSKEETLQIICGAPNVASGQKVIVALDGAVLPGDFKIKKSKIRGVESNGMICSLDELGIEKKYHNEDGIHVLSEDTEVGSDPLTALLLDDTVMELDLTPNRADLLSMMGVAYDTKAILNSKLHFPKVEVHEVSEENSSMVFTESKGCKSYYARVVKNVEIKESPAWLKARLIASGIRPINNCVDISNYVMMEYGQPLHFFDFEKITTQKIIVRDAYENEEIVTLDNQVRKLIKEDIVITDGEKPIALAGVMGGLDTEVTESTKTILIEAATFDPIRIRKTSKRLDLRSEASMRFERGLDYNRTVEACSRAAMLLEMIAGGKTLKGISYFDTHTESETEIRLNIDKINHYIGKEYTVEEIKDIMLSLSFDTSSTPHHVKVKLPSRRPDLVTAQDLYEEIVRISGYDQIPVSYPKTPTVGGLTEIQKIRRKVRSYLSNIGLDETVTYSLVTDKMAQDFNYTGIEPVKVLHPMTEEHKVMRTSILPSLIDVLTYNQSRKLNQLSVFELGRLYTPKGEIEKISALMTGDYQTSLWQGKKEVVDFYIVKGVLEGLLSSLGVENITIKPFEEAPSFLHPRQSAKVYANGKELGFIGKLHPEVEHEYSIKNVYVFELDLVSVADEISPTVIVKPIPKVPAVSRDIALVVDKALASSELISAVESISPKTLSSVEVFDLYLGEELGEDKKSIALKLVYQNPEKTLETEEVDQMVLRLLKQLEKRIGAILRK